MANIHVAKANVHNLSEWAFCLFIILYFFSDLVFFGNFSSLFFLSNKESLLVRGADFFTSNTHKHIHLMTKQTHTRNKKGNKIYWHYSQCSNIIQMTTERESKSQSISTIQKTKTREAKRRANSESNGPSYINESSVLNTVIKFQRQMISLK